MTITFPRKIRPDNPRVAFELQQNIEHLAAQLGSAIGGAFVNVKDAQFGAKGDGTTDDTTAIANAIASLPATGGTVIFPPGVYAASITITANKRICLMGYGATIKPPASGIGIHIDATVGTGALGHDIRGFTIDGANGSVTGIRVTNTDRVSIQDFRITGCTTGIELKSDASEWVEGTYITNGLIVDGTTGISFNKTASGSGSFGETVIVSVGINNFTTGIHFTNGAAIYRCFFGGITIWMNANQKGLLIDGDFQECFTQVGFESSTATGTICVDLTASAVEPFLSDFLFSFVGTFNTLTQVAGGNRIRYRRGMDYFQRGGFYSQGHFKDNGSDTWPRVQIDDDSAGGISFGSGTGAGDVSLFRNAADVLVLATGDSLHLGTATHGGGGFLQLFEQTSVPGTPPSNAVRIYAEDDSMGKTKLMAKWPGGATTQLAIEP